MPPGGGRPVQVIVDPSPRPLNRQWLVEEVARSRELGVPLAIDDLGTGDQDTAALTGGPAQAGSTSRARATWRPRAQASN